MMEIMKLLIVEDEKRLANTLKRAFEKRGYAVDVVHDGLEAKTRMLLYRDEYDVTILDLSLPHLSGDKICAFVRRAGVTFPILILTAHGDVREKVDLLHIGADDYVQKPFSFDELEARVAALLRRPLEMIPENVHSAARDITLNKQSHSVYVHGDAVSLTLKEFMLLEYFLRHPDTVITRDDLLAHAWDFEYFAFSNIIDVHVKNLRKKLERAHATTSIETIRGVGYRLVG